MKWNPRGVGGYGGIILYPNGLWREVKDLGLQAEEES